VFENRVLRRIFGQKRDEVTGGWTEMRNEELHNPYYSPNIIRMIKSRRMRWAGHVARMWDERRTHTWFWLESQKEIDVNIGVRIILKRILGEIGLYVLD
jgi:hypothetical protein